MDSIVIAPGEAALVKLRAREPFAAILDSDASARAAALETALAGLRRAGVHVVRVANPLRTPLTMERVLIQLAGFQTDLAPGEDTDTLMRTVIDRLHTGRDRLVVSVEQAETLHPLALILLDQITRPLEPDGKSPQILLTGTPAFTRMLGHPSLDRMRAVLGMGAPDPTLATFTATVEPIPQSVPAPAEPGSARPLATDTDTSNRVQSNRAPSVAPEPVPELAPEPAADPAPQPVSESAPELAPVSAPEPASAPVAPGVPVDGPTLRVTATNTGLRPALTVQQVGRGPYRSRWPLRLLLLLLVLLAIAGGVYAAWSYHLLPPDAEAAMTSWINRAIALVTSTIAAARDRLLPGAGML